MSTDQANVLVETSPGAFPGEAMHAPFRFRAALLGWMGVVAWLSCIAFFSTDSFSARHTGSILGWILEHTIGMVDPKTFDNMHYFVRKGAHVMVFCILGLLSYNAWKQSWPSPVRWMWRWALLAVLTVIIAGSMDEWHQSYVPSRTASPVDTGIDTAGGILGQIGIAVIARRKPKATA